MIFVVQEVKVIFENTFVQPTMDIKSKIDGRKGGFFHRSLQGKNTKIYQPESDGRNYKY